MNRRGFMGLFSSAAVAAPLAGKAIVEEQAKRLSGIGGLGFPGAATPDAGLNVVWGAPGRVDTPVTAQAIAKALLDKSLRGEVESCFYHEYRTIGRLDPDLAANRSFSLAAKVVYQRQRHVATRLSEFEKQEWIGAGAWHKAKYLIAKKFLGLDVDIGGPI